MVFPDAAFQEMPFEKVEKEIALAASPDSGDDLHEVIVLCVDYALQQQVALDGHGVALVCNYLDLSKNFKARTVYHNLMVPTSGVLEILWIYPENHKCYSLLIPCRAYRHGSLDKVGGCVEGG